MPIYVSAEEYQKLVSELLAAGNDPDRIKIVLGEIGGIWPWATLPPSVIAKSARDGEFGECWPEPFPSHPAEAMPAPPPTPQLVPNYLAKSPDVLVDLNFKVWPEFRRRFERIVIAWNTTMMDFLEIITHYWVGDNGEVPRDQLFAFLQSIERKLDMHLEAAAQSEDRMMPTKPTSLHEFNRAVRRLRRAASELRGDLG